MAILFIGALVLIGLNLIGGGFIAMAFLGFLIALIKGLWKFIEQDPPKSD